ncbi:MAG: SBBP repeat-containing protein, partial [Halobacteriales archaeon]|nr:SBBP repeat-containing protein [Halobacteriales archaeon]
VQALPGQPLPSAGGLPTLPAPSPRQWAVSMSLQGGNPDPAVGTDAAGPYHTNYFLGKDPAAWRTDVPTFQEVLLRDVYPGIDLRYYGASDGSLEYDFIVQPGASPAAIQLRFDGLSGRPAVDAAGDLALPTPLGLLRHAAPVTYQPAAQARQAVRSNYLLDPDGTVRFAVGPHDAARPLVIDPLLYSTYVGGSSEDRGQDVALDGSGNAYVVGYTSSANFPTTPGAYQTALVCCGADELVHVTKLGPLGRVYSTYFGIAYTTYGMKIAADGSGNAYVTGTTSDVLFPTTPGAFQDYVDASFDAFALKLNPSGSSLVYSTLLGGNGYDAATGIAVDGAGNAYLGGYSESSNFPLASPIMLKHPGEDVFVTKLNPTGTGLVYSTYLGGSGNERSYGLAIDGSGSAYVTGETASYNYPKTTGAFQTAWAGDLDAFVTKLAPAGTSIAFSTFLGGTQSDSALGIAVDGLGNALVTGNSYSGDFPVTAAAYKSASLWGYDGFLTKLDATGASLAYSTYLGFGAADIALDALGAAYVVGDADSATLPVSWGPYHAFPAGATDLFLARFTLDGSGLAYSSYLGGSSYDVAAGIAVDLLGNAYLTGSTSSTDFPTTPGAFQLASGGGIDGFLAVVPTLGSTLPRDNHDGTCSVPVAFQVGNLLAGKVWTPPFPCPNLATAQAPDGAITVYDDQNGNNRRDTGEVGATVPPL